MDDYLRDRSIIDFDDLKETIRQTADALQRLRLDRHSSKLLGETVLKKMEIYEKSLRRRLTEPFHLVLAGDFKRGKSTLINALLGKNIVPTAVTPETVTINEIFYGTEPSCEAVLENGRRLRLTPSELKREALEELSGRLPSPIRCIQIRESSEFLRDVTLVDTPGAGDLMKAFDDRAAEYLAGADAVIYVVSARSPLSLTEQAFLSSAVLPQSFARILVTVNMADCLETTEDIEKVLNLTAERVRDIFPDTRVFAISALDELCRRLEKPRPVPELAEYLENSFFAFEDALQNDILLQKEVIHSERCVHMAESILLDMEARIRRLQDALLSGVERLARQEDELKGENTRLTDDIERQKQELSKAIDAMELEAESWMLGFLSRLKAEIRSIHGTAETSELERHFQFYLADTVRQALSACISRHQADIADRVQQSLNQLTQQLAAEAAAGTEAEVNAVLPDVLWTGADTVMFFASDFLRLDEELGLLYVVGQAIAGFFRQGSLKKRQKDYLEPVLSGFDSISMEILRSLKAAYEKLKKTSVDRMDEIFQARIRSSLESIRQARTILEQEGLKREDASSELEDIRTMLAGLRENLTDAYSTQ